MSLTLGWSSSQNFVPKSIDKTNKNPLIRRKKCCLDGLVMLITDLTSNLGPWTYHKKATNYFYISFLWLWGALGGTFVVYKNPSGCFIFGPPFLDGALLLEVPSSLLEFSFRANKRIVSCCEGLHPLGPNFNLFKDHCFFRGSSSLPCSNSLMEF